MRKTGVVLLLFVIFMSCNKYEDGPALSFRSAEKRLTGKWALKEIFFNRADSTPPYLNEGLADYPFHIYSDWSGKFFIGISHTDGNIIAKSNLVINKPKTKLVFGLVPQPLYEVLATEIFEIIKPLSIENEWIIKRLKNDELWIRTNFSANNFELRFDLIADYSDN